MSPTGRVREACRALGLAVLLSMAPTLARPAQQPQRGNEQQPAPGILDLYRAGAIDFSAPPLSLLAFSIGCDASGNIYAVPGTLNSAYVEPGPVTAFFPASKRVVRYPLPAVPDYRPLLFLGFAVSPRGTVYALAVTTLSQYSGKPEPAYFVVKYNDDGTVDSYFKVGGEPGQRIQPLRMAVFGDGDLLLSGTTALDNGMGTFSAIFGRQGTFISPLKFNEAASHGGAVSASEAAELEARLAPERAKLPRAKQLEAEGKNPVALESSTLSFSSLDGNVYVVQGTSEATLYVVSPAGYVARQYHLEPPGPGMNPVQMAPAGVGYLFIYYTRVGVSATADSPPDCITVLNSETGRVAAVYRMPEGESGLGVPACAESTDGFMFLGTSKDNHLEVVRYVSR